MTIQITFMEYVVVFFLNLILFFLLVCMTLVSHVFFPFPEVWDQHRKGLVCEAKAGGQTEEAREEAGQAKGEGEAVMCGVIPPHLFSTRLFRTFSFDRYTSVSNFGIVVCEKKGKTLSKLFDLIP